MPRRQRRDRFFTEPPGDRPANVKLLNERFQQGAQGLDQPTGRTDSGAVRHSLRHFFETACVNAGVPQQVVDAWMGHGPGRVMLVFYYTLHIPVSQRCMQQVPFGGVRGGATPTRRSD